MFQRLRIVVLLFYMEEQYIDQNARITGILAGTVWGRLREKISLIGTCPENLQRERTYGAVAIQRRDERSGWLLVLRFWPIWR